MWDTCINIPYQPSHSRLLRVVTILTGLANVRYIHWGSTGSLSPAFKNVNISDQPCETCQMVGV